MLRYRALTVAERVAFAARRVRPSYLRSQRDVPTRWLGRSYGCCVVHDGNRKDWRELREHENAILLSRVCNNVGVPAGPKQDRKECRLVPFVFIALGGGDAAPEKEGEGMKRTNR